MRCPRCGGAFYRGAEEPTCLSCGYVDYEVEQLDAARERTRTDATVRAAIEREAKTVRRENVRRSRLGLPLLEVPRVPVGPRHTFERVPLDPVPGIAHRSDYWQARADEIDSQRTARLHGRAG